MLATLSINQELNGIELTFSGIPAAKIRTELKENGFRWHNVKKLWYAKKNDTRLALAEKIAGSTPEDMKSRTKKEKEVKTTHSLKVGDILSASWGYEQTNINLYQVVALNGKSFVTVRECYLDVKDCEAIGGMSEDISFILPSEGGNVRYTNDEMLRRKVVNYTKENDPAGDHVNIKDFIHAYKYYGKKLYKSWYY